MVSLSELLWGINIWWEKKENVNHLIEEKERDELKQVIEEVNSHRITSVLGPRRTGKTVLLFQAIKNLIEKGTNPKRILFISLDNKTLRAVTEDVLEEVFDFYFKEVLYEKPHEIKEKVFIFLDEIHKVEHWAEWLKNKYDFYKKIKFIISGSSALKISRKSKETLPGRTVKIHVFPLDFFQFMKLNGLKIKRENLGWDFKKLRQFYEKLRAKELEIKKLFNLYLVVGGFIEWFKVRDIFKWQRYLQDDVLNKLILGDIIEEYDIKDEEGLRRIILVLSENLGNLYSFHSLAGQALVGKDVIEKYLTCLANGFVVYILNNYSQHIKIKLRKNKKINLIDTGLVNAVKRKVSFRKEELELLIEQVVQNHYFYFAKKENKELCFCRDKEGKEVDAVLTPGLLPIEVKYSDKLTKKNLEGLLSFMQRFKVKKGIIVTKDLLKEERIEDKVILFVPVWLFLLVFD